MAEVSVVVVGSTSEHVDERQVGHTVAVAARKGPRRARYRQGTGAEHGVNQNIKLPKFNQVRRIAELDNGGIFEKLQGPQVRGYRRQRAAGAHGTGPAREA